MFNPNPKELIRALYESRAAAKISKEALKQKAQEIGGCEMEGGNRCYNTPKLPTEEWCKVCKEKLPLWNDYHKKSNASGVAMRAILRYGKLLPPNAT